MGIFITEKVALIKEILQMPTVVLNLNNKQILEEFTKPHPKYFFVQKKSIGVAMLPIVKSADEYLLSINGKNSAAYYARKACKRGYSFSEINPNKFVDDIYQINISKEYRQGRILSDNYREKINQITIDERVRYFGVLSSNAQLIAYAFVPHYGDVWILSKLLGHGNYLNDGIMYLLITHIILEIFKLPQEKRPKFLMYDTWYGAQPGMKMFKSKFGFRPYWVKWKL